MNESLEVKKIYNEIYISLYSSKNQLMPKRNMFQINFGKINQLSTI